MDKIDIIYIICLFLIWTTVVVGNMYIYFKPKRSEVRVLPAQVNQIPNGQGNKAIEELKIPVQAI